MTDEHKQLSQAQQQNDVLEWHLNRGECARFPDFDAIRSGDDVFSIPCGPLVKEGFVRMVFHVPGDIECRKTETGFVLVNPKKVN